MDDRDLCNDRWLAAGDFSNSINTTATLNIYSGMLEMVGTSGNNQFDMAISGADAVYTGSGNDMIIGGDLANFIYVTGTGLKVLALSDSTYDFVELSGISLPSKLVMTYVGSDLYLTSSDSEFLPVEDPNAVIVVGATDETHTVESMMTADGNWAFGGFSFGHIAPPSSVDLLSEDYKDPVGLSSRAFVSGVDPVTDGMVIQVTVPFEQQVDYVL